MSNEHVELERLIMGRTTTAAVEAIVAAGYRKQHVEESKDIAEVLELHQPRTGVIAAVGGRGTAKGPDTGSSTFAMVKRQRSSAGTRRTFCRLPDSVRARTSRSLRATRRLMPEGITTGTR